MRKIFILMTLCCINSANAEIPDGRPGIPHVDFEGSKNCYHNGEYYATVRPEWMCPMFTPVYNPVSQTWAHISTDIPHSAYHDETDERCVITVDYN